MQRATLKCIEVKIPVNVMPFAIDLDFPNTSKFLDLLALRQEDPIYWGEVCPHGNQSFEAQQRQQGNICINLASRAMFNPDECPDVEHEFKENDVVAIIDCQSFVPEYIPVIRALEQQEQDLLPFDDGVMLNLDANRKSDLTNTVLGADAQNKAAAEEEFQRRIFQQFEYQDDSSDDYDNDDAQNNTHVVKTVTKLPLPLIEKLVSDMISSSVRCFMCGCLNFRSDHMSMPLTALTLTVFRQFCP